MIGADWLRPDWPAPVGVQACVTTRLGGVSQSPFASFNLGNHVGDDPAAVAENRRRLGEALECQPAWLEQVHGTAVVEADPTQVLRADAAWTATPGVAVTMMTADCLPALFCRRDGSRVAAAHAGWRGLAGGVLEAAAASLEVAPAEVLVWLGPAIGPASFEVGAEVREAFVAQQGDAERCFVARGGDKYLGDLYALARLRLAAQGITAVYGGGFDTFADDQRFFSYRRAARTGRFASLIWIKP
ncbi:peptidoglycan editing factor PgeF [Pseudomonas sp. CBMAI 2609]|uniref:Purine nucleoside phosphorylase n=1 Tax=Pseudomonas flavocrustae TaxID=2991719 RepID=A0ABT6IQS0_9PSED|nr:peptidoglycan editing factor PgeF [Pseudomonas sp. CBMAI 2609]MDH4765995.1 peptidoglycan editing factor PgeF [Pseudomonas sp. CBMAI 2609]